MIVEYCSRAYVHNHFSENYLQVAEEHIDIFNRVPIHYYLLIGFNKITSISKKSWNWVEAYLNIE